MRDRDEEVGMLDTGLTKRTDGRVGRRFDGHQVAVGRDAFQLGLVFINDGDVLFDFGE